MTNIDYSKLKINPNHSKDDITIIRIDNYSDLKQLIYGKGFYIIITDYKYMDNECSLMLKPENKNVKAIYRGHCYRLRKRVESHLFNKKYNLNKDSTNFECCMKIEDGTQGINRDESTYKDYVFYVIQHKMKESK